ncbi:MAG: PH domain-containing protein [Sphingomicrobium sp.]
MNSVPAGDRHTLGPAERLHPLFLLTGLGGTVRGAWGMLAIGALFASQGRWWLVAVLVGVSFVLSLGRLLLRWLRLEYRVGPHEIRIDTGLLNRTSRAIPFDRVQDVDIEQGPVQRLLGLAQVRFETGAAAGTSDDGLLHTISLERAEALRRQVRANRARVSALVPAPAEPREEAPPLFALSNRRLLVAGLFNFSLVVLAGLFGLSQTVGNVAGFDPFSRRFWNEALASIAPLQAYVAAHQFVTILAGATLLLALGAATGIVRTVLRDYGFRLERVARAFRRRRGLLTLTDVSLPLARVQAAIVATGPVRRALGWFELKLQSLAQDLSGGKGDHVVAPLARDHEISRILTELGWPAGPGAREWRNVSRAFLHLFLLAMIPFALIGAVQAAFVPWLGAATLTVVLVASVLRIRAWPRTRYALGGEFLFVESGWWRQHRLLLPLARVQSADVTDNALTRLLGVATLRLGVAGGGGGFSDHHVPALPRAVAFDLRAAILT